MSELTSRNNQIAGLQSSVSSLSALLAQKREELRRLKQARSRLVDDQQEFHQRANLLVQPPLPVTPWKGELADDFQSFRDGPLTAGYQDIATSQLNEVLSRIDAKIIALQNEIASLERQIASARSRISSLRD